MDKEIILMVLFAGSLIISIWVFAAFDAYLDHECRMDPICQLTIENNK
jgi:hypothetical protein